MWGIKQLIVVLIAAALMAALLASCGSSDSGDSTSAGASSVSNASETEATETEGAASFIKPGKKNKLVEFGEEADTAEREEASAVLEENLDARAAGDWKGQCASLAAKGIEEVEKASGIKGNCPKGIEKMAQPLVQTKAIRANTMTEPIAALRVEGGEAFALFHGAAGVNYAMPMVQENGEWKVGALQTQRLP